LRQFSLVFVAGILLLRNDPLDAVWRESERGLDFVRKAGYGDVADNIVSQQRFIGPDRDLPPFSDAQFGEATLEAQLMANRTAMMVCFGTLEFTTHDGRFLLGPGDILFTDDTAG
jgi:hypothetical protein